MLPGKSHGRYHLPLRHLRVKSGRARLNSVPQRPLAIYHAYYNFCRVHQTLRVTPAIEAGLTDHAWTLEELVELLDTVTSKAAA